MKLSIVIPVYNEAGTVLEVLRRVRNVKLPVEKQVIVVDDGSSDGTSELLKDSSSLADKIIFLEKNSGKGAAVKMGLKAAEGDYVLIQDSDLEYDPNDYPPLFAPILKGEARTVFGSRFLRKNKRNYFYALGNILATRIFNLFFGTRLTDLATCYKIFPVELRDSLNVFPADDFVFDVVDLTYAIKKADFEIKEIPISYEPRPYHEKKLKIRYGLKIFAEIFRLARKNQRCYL